MSDLKTKFETSVEEVKKLSKRPDNDVLLKLYALYKQSTEGNNAGKKPGLMDFVGRAKYDAWMKLQNMSQEDSMKSYIELVSDLKSTNS